MAPTSKSDVLVNGIHDETSAEDSIVPIDKANISSLLKLINSNVADILSQYETVGTTLPSLDSTDPESGPFASNDTSSPELRRAIRIVQAACGQLCASITDPVLTLFTNALAMKVNACIGVAVGAKLADHLAEHPEGLSAVELSKITGLDADKLGRVLRLLSTRHIFREKETNVFANNRVSMRLRSQDPNHALMRFLCIETSKAAPFIFDTMADDKVLSDTSVYEFYHKRKMFEHYETAEGREQGENFARAMIGYGSIIGQVVLAQCYPWRSIPQLKQITICDVGGGNGSVMMSLLRAYPGHSFKAIIQDQPNVLEHAKKLWETEFPEAVSAKKVEFQRIDFLNEPPVAGCDFYHMRSIIHNWSNEKAMLILQNIAKAMRAKATTSRLFIHDYVLHSAASTINDSAKSSSKLGVEPAPAPLLPNYGLGAATNYNMDILMFVLCGAKERTLDEQLKLTSECGLEFQREWDAGEASILEFALSPGLL